MLNQAFLTVKWLQQIRSLVALFLIPLLLPHAVAANWHTLAPGIEYQDLNSSYLAPWSHLHAFRINLKYNQLSLIMAKDLAMQHASIEAYAKHSNALITINGGFFDTAYQPLGLRINNKQQQSPLKKISWWGIFYIKDNQAYLSGAREFTYDQHITFALQSGPRLLVNGHIPLLKPGRTERSALGITKNGHIIILITNNIPLSTTELAQVLKATPLNCVYALNLDGGSSSQLWANIGSFQLSVPGFSNVSDAIIVKAR